jgi:hypothetical protein
MQIPLKIIQVVLVAGGYISLFVASTIPLPNREIKVFEP